jgi:hypothetical protein
MANAATISQSQETPHPPHPRAAPRPQLNEARTATSVAASHTTSTSPSPVSGGGAPSSSGATTPNNAQPTAATAAETAEAGGTSYVVVDDEDDEPVVKKRKLKSDVWLEFDQVKVAERQKAQCHWCKKVLAGDGKSGTNYLRGHLRSCASHQVRKGLQQSTLKLAKNERGGVVVEKYVFDQQVARKELSLMICVHEYPLSMVDHIGFRKFCAALQPLFKLVSRNTIKKIYWICMMFKGSLW